jgi:seryl-tRNA synthetase
MGNLATLLTVALVCAAFGFVAGSMLTSIWIDRHSRPSRSRRKLEKPGDEFARILLGDNNNSTSLEIDGEVYTSSHYPDAKMMEKLKPASELMSQWLQKNEVMPVKKKIAGMEAKTGKMKSSAKESAEKTEVHDMLFEINNIIQKILENSSDSERKIRIAREGTTGVSFWVGETSYTTLDDIPDNHVRDLIKGAVADWETQVR